MEKKTLYRSGLCVALIAAILLGLLWYPGASMKPVEPENPLAGEDIQDIVVLNIGEELRALEPIAVPSGGLSQQQRESADGGEETPKETTRETPRETQPETTVPDPTADGQGDEGRENENQEGQDSPNGKDGEETSQDLSLELRWKKNDGSIQTVSCSPDKTAAFSVNSYDVHEALLQYALRLNGTSAADAEIVEAAYVTASGQAAGKLEIAEGTLILTPATGTDSEVYSLHVTVKTPEREVLFRFDITYREMLDVRLSFTWWEGGRTERTLPECQPGETVFQTIKNNQLSAGAIRYALALTGDDAASARIRSIRYASDSGSGKIEASGSLPLSMPAGTASNTYRITVEVQARGQRLTFEVDLQYVTDVTLQMCYTLADGTLVEVNCENGRQKTAVTVYDDQLTDGQLDFTLSLLGEDAQGITIDAVSCFQSGSGRERTLSKPWQTSLLLKDGKTGENRFTIQASDASGSNYIFKINVPYKHRGTMEVRIVTNLDHTDELVNGTTTNLWVEASTLDEAGNVTGYIPANGTDTILQVFLDDVEISYKSSSGVRSEYDLYPENPEIGDENTHTLRIIAEDANGNRGEIEKTFTGRRQESGQVIGNADIYIDMTVLGLGVIGPVRYKVLADEPISYVVAKAVMGMDTGEPYGAADSTFGFSGSYSGALDRGFYLQSLTTGYAADALEGGAWPGGSEEAVLEAIDQRFGSGTGLASLWRCLYRNGLNKSTGSGGTFGEFDYTSGSGWMYSVGGTTYYPGQSMSAVYLRDGDALTLRYTLAYGWDVGGGSAGYGNTVGYCVTALNGSIRIHHQMEQVENSDGSISNVCHCCGLVETCAHEHTDYKDLGDGTHILFCEDCQTTIGDAAPHNWIQGADSHTCSECGAEEAHSWIEVEGTNTATCTDSGVRRVKCSVCAAEKEEEAAPKGHTLDNRWNYTAADHYQKCTTCGEELNRGPHQYRYSAEWDDDMCDICGALHDDDIGCPGPLTIREATCQRITYDCGGCGYVLIREGTFEAYHVYENGICRYCGAEDPNHTPEHTHEYSTQTVSPTCTEPGYILYTCACGDSYTETIPATGHSWGEWTVITEPTEEEEGARVRICAVCGAEDWQSIERLDAGSVSNVLARFLRKRIWGEHL